MKIDHLTAGDLARILKKRLLPLLLALLLCGTAGFCLRALLPTMYGAEATFLVRSMQSEAYLQTYGLTSAQQAVMQTEAKAYAEAIPMADALLDRAIASHGLPVTRAELRAMVTAEADGTRVVVTVTHKEGVLATRALQALAAEIPAFLQETFWPDLGMARACVAPLQIAGDAERASISPFALGALLALDGFVITYCFYLFRFLFGKRVADAAEVARVLPDVRVLAEVPFVGAGESAEESFFPLRERLPERPANQALTVAVFSPTPRAGAGFVARGLAASLGKTGARVLYLDADLRGAEKPTALQAERGLAAYLADAEADPALLVQKSNMGYDVLPAGETAANPAEYPFTARLLTLLGALAPRYDYIVAKLPATALAPEALLGARVFDTALAVAAPRLTVARDLRAVFADAAADGTKLCGVAVNHAPHTASHKI